ncbi:hypothetical protein N7490_007760 [Penicillium lividum]|nr:hypothetical protein N7490_007760 [Penicillium lividum]
MAQALKKKEQGGLRFRLDIQRERLGVIEDVKQLLWHCKKKLEDDDAIDDMKNATLKLPVDGQLDDPLANSHWSKPRYQKDAFAMRQNSYWANRNSADLDSRGAAISGGAVSLASGYSQRVLTSGTIVPDPRMLGGQQDGGDERVTGLWPIWNEESMRGAGFMIN